MKMARRDVYLVAGLGMIVGSFFAAARALGAILAIIYFFASTDFSQADPSIGENLANTLKTTLIPGAVQGIGSFLILFFGGRWMLRGPRLLNRWIEGGDRSEQERSSTSRPNEATKSQHPTA